MQHVPRINGEIPSVDEATSDHQRLIDRSHAALFCPLASDIRMWCFCINLYFQATFCQFFIMTSSYYSFLIFLFLFLFRWQVCYSTKFSSFYLFITAAGMEIVVRFYFPIFFRVQNSFSLGMSNFSKRERHSMFRTQLNSLLVPFSFPLFSSLLK